MNSDRDHFKRLAERAGFVVRPERIEEAAQLTRENVEALRLAFQPKPLTALPGAFQCRLERIDE